MSTPQQKACGTWPSPISSERINLKVITLDDTLVDPVTSTLYHIANTGVKSGQSVIIESFSGREIVGDPFNIQTVVNSYGRAAAAVLNGLMYFNNLNDHRIYQKVIDEVNVVPVSPNSSNFRFAHLCIHPKHNHLIVCIMEDHTDRQPNEVVTSLVCINAETSTVSTVVSGADFYINPAFNSDGSKLTWIQWNHPYMQWHASQLYVADVVLQMGRPDPNSSSLKLENTKFIAGQPDKDAVFQATWLPSAVSQETSLLFSWDRDQLCEPWIWSPISSPGGDKEIRPVLRSPHRVEGDFGLPVWWLDDSYFAILNEKICVCVTVTRGLSSLNKLNLRTGSLETIPNEYVFIQRLRKINDSSVAFVGITSSKDAQLVYASFDMENGMIPTFKVLYSADLNPLDESYVSRGMTLTIPKSNGDVTYAFYYSPKNPHFVPLAGEKPPCILSLHSGPTYHSTLGFTWYRQYYTSRGFAWLDVEYSGSSGFGKDYRNRLDGNYGIKDVEDIIEAANFAGSLGIYDRNRVVLRSSSGGTLPQLQTFVTFPNAFAGAAAHFVVADPEKLVPGLDKFTKYYVARLMGGTPQEIPEVYKERSPILHVNQITRPLQITHSKSLWTFPQAEAIKSAIEAKGGSLDFIVFETVDSVSFQKLYDLELKFFQDILLSGTVDST